jgi:ABC-2 type transport system permease protein
MAVNSLRLYWALNRNGFAEFFRDPLVNMFAFAMPILFFVIFAVTSAVTGIGTAGSRAPVWQFAIVSATPSDEALNLARHIDSLSTVTITRMSAQVAERLFNKGGVQVVITVPPDWRGIGQGTLRVRTRPIAIRAVQDALAVADASQTTPLRNVVRGVAAYSVEATTGANFYQFTMTGLLGFALLQLGLYGTASPVLVSKHQGIFRRYGLTPMPVKVLMLSHVTVRLAIAMLQVLVLTLGAMLVVGLELKLGLLLHVVITMVSASALISFGYLIGGWSKRQSTGMIIVLILNFYMMMFGQVFADLQNVPVLGTVIYFNPLTYVADAYRHVFLGPEDRLLPWWGDVLVLVGWTAIFLGLAARTFTFDARSR